MEKRTKRLRRAVKTRMRVQHVAEPRLRLSVHRSSQHIYAQIIERVAEGESRVLVSASTIDKELRPQMSGTKVEKASFVGLNLAKRAIAAGIKTVAFDRSGFKYHGRVKALAEAAREGGLDF